MRNFRSYNFNSKLQVFAQDEVPPSSDEPTPDTPTPAPEEPELSSTDDKTRQLMSQATDYQNRANDLQEDINVQLDLIRKALAKALQENMNQTVTQTDTNSVTALGFYNRMESKMAGLVEDDCYTLLVSTADNYLDLAGMQIGNILKSHDKKVTVALEGSEEIIKKFDVTSTEVQRIVMRSFIQQNLFRKQDDIKNIFTTNFNLAQADWDKVKPTITVTIQELTSRFVGFNENLAVRFLQMVETLDDSYQRFEKIGVSVCEEWSRSGRSFKSGIARFSAVKFFNPEDILPKFPALE